MPTRTTRTAIVQPWTVGGGGRIADLFPLPAPIILTGRFIRWCVRRWRATLTILTWIAGAIHWHQWLLPTILVGLVWTGVFTILIYRAARRGAGGSKPAARLADAVKTYVLRRRLEGSWETAAGSAGITLGGRGGVVPRLNRIRATDRGFTAEVRVNGTGKAVEDLGAKASVIADAVGALEVEVERAKPGVARFAFHYRDALAGTVSLADLPPAPAGHVCFGVLADGRPALLDAHLSVIIGGATGSGKSSMFWAMLGGHLRAGTPVRLNVIDPKGGMELGALGDQLRKGTLDDRGLVVEGYVSRAADAEELITNLHARMMDRAAKLKAAGKRSFKPSRATPLEVLVIDEGLAVSAILKKGADSPLGELCFMGRAPGFVVVFLSQVGHADAIGRIRDLIPQRACMRTNNRPGTDAVLGEGAHASGAAASRIDKSTPGVGYVMTPDGYARFRAAYVDDTAAASIAAGRLPMGVHPERGEKTCLYRWYAEDGTLLYVGISNRPDLRVQQHAGDKSWWQEVASNTTEWYPNRDAALAAEEAAIKTERPRYNKQHNERVTRRRKVRTKA